MDIREQIKNLRLVPDYLEAVSAKDDCYAAADTMEKLLAVYEAAKDVTTMGQIPECDCSDCCVVRELNEALAAVQTSLNRGASSTARASGCDPEDGGSIPLPPSAPNT